MKFLVCEKQQGHGCDYTIGCGMLFRVVEAADAKALEEKLIWPEGRDEYNTLTGDETRVQLMYVPFEHVVTMDLATIKAELDAACRREREKATEQAELQQLAKLKQKYPQGVSTGGQIPPTP